MIGRLFWYLMILVIAIAVGLALKTNSGYLLIEFGHWIMGMPLWFALLVLLITGFLFYCLLSFFQGIRNFSHRCRYWYQKHQNIKRNETLVESFLLMGEGRYREAEHVLFKQMKPTDKNSVMIYLAAAYAAQKQQKYAERDDYLYQISSLLPQAEFTLNLIQTQFYLESNYTDSALTLLTRIRTAHKHHPYILELLKNIYLQLADWPNLLALLPLLRKYGTMKNAELKSLEQEVYFHMLQIPAQPLVSVKRLWKSLPYHLKEQPSIVKAYCLQLIQSEEFDSAVQLLKDFLSTYWNDELVLLLGQIPVNHPEKLLKIAEEWLPQHKQEAALLLTLGRIAIALKHWAKAEEYLMASLNVHENRETYAALGKVYENISKPEKAINAYRRGIHLP